MVVRGVVGNKEGISKKGYCILRNLATDEGATSEYLESLNRLGLTVAKQVIQLIMTSSKRI